MFVYSFTNYAGHDRVFQSFAKIPKKHNPGDLLWVNEQYGLLLGENISFIEQYKTKWGEQREVIEHYPKFLSYKTQEVLHWMVYTWFSTYKKIIPLYISNDIDYLIKNHSPKKKVILESGSIFLFDKSKNIFNFQQKKNIGQQLIVFPDLRSLYNMIDINSLPSDVTILSSQTSAKQKAKIFRGLKYNKLNTLLTTHSGIFQDRSDLRDIIVVHPDRRYYTNYQEPRYKTAEILKKMSEVYGSNISFIQ